MAQRRSTRRILVVAILAALIVPTLGYTTAAASNLALPTPTGPHAVGRLRLAWSDPTRPEIATPAQGDTREVIAEVWYPALPGTGDATPYVPELARVADGLIASSELGPVQAWGLRFVRAHGRAGADVAAAPATFPVLLFSPGGATNAEFYASFVEDLASRGYVVVGLNHPYDVAAVALADGTVATYTRTDTPDSVALRVDERAADLRFALDRLGALNQGDGPLAGRLDLDRVGALGHSLGGLAAAQACATDSRIKGCANLDGIQAGGPFGARPADPVPGQPFVFITKEASPPPALATLLAAHPNATRVVIPGAAHRDFSDGPLFEPAPNPFSRPIERANAQIRTALREFFERVLGA